MDDLLFASSFRISTKLHCPVATSVNIPLSGKLNDLFYIPYVHKKSPCRNRSRHLNYRTLITGWLDKPSIINFFCSILIVRMAHGCLNVFMLELSNSNPVQDVCLTRLYFHLFLSLQAHTGSGVNLLDTCTADAYWSFICCCFVLCCVDGSSKNLDQAPSE